MAMKMVWLICVQFHFIIHFVLFFISHLFFVSGMPNTFGWSVPIYKFQKLNTSKKMSFRPIQYVIIYKMVRFRSFDVYMMGMLWKCGVLTTIYSTLIQRIGCTNSHGCQAIDGRFKRKLPRWYKVAINMAMTSSLSWKIHYAIWCERVRFEY